jgi:hypothetical protein
VFRHALQQEQDAVNEPLPSSTAMEELPPVAWREPAIRTGGFMALGAVTFLTCLVLAWSAPWFLFVLFVLAVPVLAKAMFDPRSRGRPRLWKMLGTFFAALGVSTLVGMAAMFAGYVIFFLGMILGGGDTGLGRLSFLPRLTGLMAGLVVAYSLYYLAWFRRRKKP